MGPKSQTGIIALHAGIGVLVIAGATVLAALHVLDAQATVAIYGAVIGLAGGSAASIAALGTTVNGKSVVTAEQAAAQSANLEAAVRYLAGARAELDSSRVAGGRRATDPERATAPEPPPPPPASAFVPDVPPPVGS